jgi:hypothetical protein
MLRFASASRRSAAGWTILLALVFSSCGEESDEGGFSPVVSDPTSKVEFLRQADEICFSTESRIEAAADDLLAGKGEPAPEEVEEVAIGIVIPALETEVAAIGALSVPEGDEDQVQAILDATQAGIEEIEADPQSLLDGPPDSLVEAEQLARRYGSRQCGIR